MSVNLLLLRCGGSVIVSPWGRPSTSWQSWTEAGGDATQTNSTADGQLDDNLTGTHWLSGDSPTPGSPYTAGGNTNRPIWLASGINSLPAWDFDGLANNTTGEHAVRAGTGYTGELSVIFVFMPTVTTGTRYVFSGNASTKTRIYIVSGGAINAHNGSIAAVTGATVSANAPVVIAMRWKTGEGLKTWVNGVATGTIASTHTQYKGADVGTNNFLGRGYSTNLSGFQGRLGAIGFAFAALSDNIIEADSLALKSRYGI